MKVGDIVKLRGARCGDSSARPERRPVGVVTDFVDRKCWRTDRHGKNTPVDWSMIDPESHAVVLFENGIMRIPVVDLKVVDAPSNR